MRFTCEQLRFLSPLHMKILSSFEAAEKRNMGSVIPLKKIHGASSPNMENAVTDLLRQRLIRNDPTSKEKRFYLTYSGHDILALDSLVRNGVLHSLGTKIGVGKESDVYIGETPQRKDVVVKIHRLGRTSFRTVKRKRTYYETEKNFKWMQLSCVSAEREFRHMVELKKEGIPVPEPIAIERHIVVMDFLREYCLLSDIPRPKNPQFLYGKTLEILNQMFFLGYVHGDYNEFNIMVSKNEEDIVVIDFPQMMKGIGAEQREYFERDLKGIQKFFAKFERGIGNPPEESS